MGVEQSGNSPKSNRDLTAFALPLSWGEQIRSRRLGIFFGSLNNKAEMQKKQDSHGVVYEVDMETMKAFNISSVRARMEALKEAQSEAWNAILRTGGGYVDFELDDLVALEARAEAEWGRARVEARQGMGSFLEFEG